MCGDRKFEDIEWLARLAARLAGRDPDSRISVKIGALVAFDDVAWRYPDFLQRAEEAYALLGGIKPSSSDDEEADE